MTKRPLPEHDDEVDVKREQATSKKFRENSSVDAEAIIKDEYDEEVDENVSTNAAAVNFVVKKEERKKCPYLDTVNRQLLDFDMEKVCSVTLSNLNVYCCLICGKYFQGRGKSTPAYTHSVGSGHFVFIHLHDVRAFCLPDGYEILDSSLDDVKKCLAPTFTKQDISVLNKNFSLARDVYGVNYLPGFVGLNNLKHTDCVNVVLHALSHVTPVRDFFLQSENYSTSKSVLVGKFGEVVRKLWSPYNFKSIVSPQDFLQEISVASKKRFNIGVQAEAADLLAWLLSELHRGLNGTLKNGTIISNTFGGLIEVTTMTKRGSSNNASQAADGVDAMGRDIRENKNKNNENEKDSDIDGWSETITTTPFTFLSLDIPPTPLFRDSEGGLIIPQIPLFQVLQKFNGQTWTDQIGVNTHTRKKYVIRKLPQYLILHLVRFTKNNFFHLEKNRSVVTFPVKNLSLKDYQFPIENTTSNSTSASSSSSTEEHPSKEQLEAMSVGELKTCISTYGCSAHTQEMATVIEKEVLLQLALTAVEWGVSMKAQLLAAKYDLVANVCHDSSGAQDLTVKAGSGTINAATKAAAAAKSLAAGKTPGGSYRCHTQNKATGQWFELQDLHVSETMPQLIGLSEAYILIYERKGGGEK